MSMKLYVGNLAFQTTSEDLQQLFAQAGTVESASVVEDRMTGRSRGFAFVEMATKEEAASAASVAIAVAVVADAAAAATAAIANLAGNYRRTVSGEQAEVLCVSRG